jgi:hypothetical protein
MRIAKALSDEAGQESGDALSRPKASTLVLAAEKSMHRNSTTARADLGARFSVAETFITAGAEEALEIAGENRDSVLATTYAWCFGRRLLSGRPRE